MRILSGKLKGSKILTNDKKFKGRESFITRPTSDRVKETLFNIMEYGFNIDFSKIAFFDCFSGSGAVGIEAISRGCSTVTFLDKDNLACKCITKNLAKFKIPATVEFIASLPRNATGKVLKRNLREEVVGGDAPAIT